MKLTEYFTNVKNVNLIWVYCYSFLKITNTEYAPLKVIADEGSINRGAKTLGLSVYRPRQSASAIEQHHGIAFFDNLRGRSALASQNMWPELSYTMGR